MGREKFLPFFCENMSNTDFNIGVIKPIECLKEAWGLIKADYWLLFAVSLVGIMIGGMTLYIALGAMICGIYICFIEVIDGKKANFESLFKGFSFFFPSLLVTFIIIVPTIFLFIAVYSPFIVAATMGSRLSEQELLTLLAGSFAVDFVIAIVMICFHTLLMFAFPLIIDRQLSGSKAILLSAKAVWKNLSGVVGLWLVMFVLSLLGAIVCIGTYFVIPVIIATTLVAYRKVFPNLNSQQFNVPPSPSNYNL
jgi:hypothetical protein